MNISQDLRNTESLVLDNGLRVLLINKPEADVCCVALSCKAGHFFDPDDCPGLSHLLEHMLFMGNQQLPDANAVNECIEQAGGSINAWTGTEFANYHFQAHAQALPRLLPAFASMLTHPLFALDKIDAEIQSIEAEFQYKRKDDLRRLYQIHKETANPEHPFSKFSVGNASIFRRFTLEDLQVRLRQYHQHHYGASNQTLCIYSPYSRSQIEPWIVDAFCQMPSGTAAVQRLPNLYTEQQLAVEISIKPLQNARRMIVTFALPPLHLDINNKPLDFVSHVLGDEGSGSLFSYLKAKGWVTNLIAGSGVDGSTFKDFNINIQLTQLGLAKQKEIIDAIFYSLHLLSNASSQQWRLDEKAKLNRLANQYDDAQKPLPMVIELSELHQHFDWRAIADSILAEGLNKDCLLNALSYFRPENLRVKIIAPETHTTRQCAYYDARYNITPIAAQQINSWQSVKPHNAIKLPPANPFIGDSYTLVQPDSQFALPQQITKQKGSEFWFCQDHEFKTPKGDIYLSFDIPSLTQNIHKVAAKRLWLAALNDHLQGQFYRAEIAGLHYRIYGHQGGFSLHTRGFSAQQGRLVTRLITAIKDFTPDPQSFKQIQLLQCQSLQNSLLNKPINRLFSRLSVLIQRNTHAPIEMLAAVQECQFDDLRRVKMQAFDYFHLDGLIHGNWTVDTANRIAASVTDAFSGAHSPPLQRAIAKLPVGKTLYHCVQCEHDDAAVVLYLQAPSNDTLDVAMCMILEQMLAGAFFTTLRTEKQLGYLVGSGYVPHNRHPGIAFYIQSPNNSPQVLLSHMSEFLLQQTKEKAFYAEYWPHIQRNLLKQLQDVDLNQSMRSQRIWQSLGAGDVSLSKNQSIADAIRNISFDDIERYATNMNLNQTFGQIVLYAPGRFKPIKTNELDNIANIADFKSKVEFYL